jgi:GxxExxY protein
MTEETPSALKKQYDPIPARTEEVAKIILDGAFKVHSVLGPGLQESVYETCLVHELKSKCIQIQNQLTLPITYEGIRVDSGLRLDLMVENCVIVEIKAVECIIPLYKAQLLTYMKLTKIRIGLLINFNTIHLRDGIERLIY